MCWPNLPKLHFWANSECNLHVPIRPQLDLSIQSIENMPILYPLGILESYFCEYWKYSWLFTHWVHWSQMAGHIQNVLSMCPLGISGAHSGVYSKCTQHLITGHIRVTCWLWSQCFHHVPSWDLGPCPQWEQLSCLWHLPASAASAASAMTPFWCDKRFDKNVNSNTKKGNIRI